VACSLAAKIASVLGGAVIPMENYYDPSVTVDDSNDFESIDFSLLIQNLQDLLRGNNIMLPEFDFQEKKRTGFTLLNAPKSGVVLVEGTYALHSKLRSLLDIRVAVVGGVHFNLLSKVRRDIGETLSLDHLIDSIFPTFRTHIEPDLHHAQVSVLITLEN
jgi:uridine kinase